MTTIAKAPEPVVHLKSREEDDTAVCGHKPQDAYDILVDTLDDDPGGGLPGLPGSGRRRG